MNILSYLKSFLDKVKTNAATKSPTENIKELEDFLNKQNESLMPQPESGSSSLPKYERYEYEAPSDESLRMKAENELNDYLQNGEKSIKNEYDAKEKSLNDAKSSSEMQFNDSRDKLKSAYEQTAQALSNDSLKRGLARSSIALNNQAEAGNAYMQNVNDLIKQRNERIAEIDNELNSLSGQLQSALDSFKISYAAKLTQKINELKGEREKNKQEAIKYNNSIASREYEDRIAKEERDKDAYKDEIQRQKSLKELRDSLPDYQKKRLEREFFDKAVEILDSLPREEAQKLFNGSSIFKDNLSDYYYYTLYYKYR